jgi:hypothetical protein
VHRLRLGSRGMSRAGLMESGTHQTVATPYLRDVRTSWE